VKGVEWSDEGAVLWDALEIAEVGPLRLRAWKRECNDDAGNPAYGWAVAATALQDAGGVDDDAAFFDYTIAYDLASAKAAAEQAALGLLVDAVSAFPCEAPGGLGINDEGAGLCVPGEWAMRFPDDAITLGRALLCAGVAARKAAK
jgi:hypothetical protein